MFRYWEKKNEIQGCFIYCDFIQKYFQTSAWIYWNRVSRMFSKIFFKIFFSEVFQFARALYWESNIPNCLWYPLFVETSTLLFKSNLWAVGENKLTVIDLWSSVRVFQPKKSTEIASGFEYCLIYFSSNPIKLQVLDLSSLKSLFF